MLSKVIKWLWRAAFACVLIAAVNYGGLASREVSNGREEPITITPGALKSDYDLQEPVGIALHIANNGSEPFYIYMDHSGVIDYLVDITVRDANNVKIWWSDKLETVQAPPPHYYLKRDGKSILTVPVTEVKPGQSVQAMIPDVLKVYRHRLQRGTYCLTLGYMPVIHEVSSIITRKDVPHPLWIDPFTVVRRSRCEVGVVTIRIQ